MSLPNLMHLQGDCARLEDTDGPIRDMLSDLNLRGKLMAHGEMRTLLEEASSEFDEPLTFELYADSQTDPDQERPIAILNFVKTKAKEIWGGDIVISYAPDVKDWYKYPFSFEPHGFRIVNPPNWLKFENPSSHVEVKQGANNDGSWGFDTGAKIVYGFPYDAFKTAANIPVEEQLTVKDKVIMEQKWFTRTQKPNVGFGLGAQPMPYDKRFNYKFLATATVYLEFETTPAETTKRRSYLEPLIRQTDFWQAIKKDNFAYIRKDGEEFMDTAIQLVDGMRIMDVTDELDAVNSMVGGFLTNMRVDITLLTKNVDEYDDKRDIVSGPQKRGRAI